jgi:hypothetical protein
VARRIGQDFLWLTILTAQLKHLAHTCDIGSALGAKPFAPSSTA